MSSTSIETEESNNNKDQQTITQSIKEEQEKEVSYVLEASQADDKRSKYLAKKNEYKIMFDDGHEETFKRIPLSSKKNKEIDDLRTAFTSTRFDTSSNNKKVKVAGKEYESASDVLYEAFRRTAQYCLGMTSEQYDSAIWEDDIEYVNRDIYGLRSVLGACLLRAVHGIAYFRQP